MNNRVSPFHGFSSPSLAADSKARAAVVPTAAAVDLMQAFLRAKWQRMMKLFSTWTEADILAFSELFARYNDGMRDQYPGRG